MAVKDVVKVKVPGAEYKVSIRSGMITELSRYLTGHKGNIYYLIDSNVYRLHKAYLSSTLLLNKSASSVLTLKVSEKSKNLQTVEKILKFLQKNGADRKSVLVVIGGGILGDIGSFAASVYMRGIPYIAVPTTILSAIDSSVGGKTGVNFNHKKNFIGSFYQPESVWVDTGFFTTLPKSEVNCGLGELMKYGFLSSKNFFSEISRYLQSDRDTSSLQFQSIVKKCIRIKAEIVAKDEKETGPRKLLNLGHTFAHGIESLLDFKVKHGEAVAAGLLFMVMLSHETGMIKHSTNEQFIQYCRLLNLPAGIKKLSVLPLIKAMRGDKKNVKGEFRFVLVREGGKVDYDVIVNQATLKKSMQKTLILLKSK